MMHNGDMLNIYYNFEVRKMNIRIKNVKQLLHKRSTRLFYASFLRKFQESVKARINCSCEIVSCYNKETLEAHIKKDHRHHICHCCGKKSDHIFVGWWDDYSWRLKSNRSRYRGWHHTNE